MGGARRDMKEEKKDDWKLVAPHLYPALENHSGNSSFKVLTIFVLRRPRGFAIDPLCDLEKAPSYLQPVSHL